jgi:hypothetical protein
MLIVAFSRDSQPRYQGVKLSDWLNSIKGARTSHDLTVWPVAADKAVQNIGANGLPCLVKWIGYEKAAWKSSACAGYQKWPRWLVSESLVNRLSYDPGERLGDNAVLAFRILGRDAAPAVPQLIALLRDRKRPAASHRAIICLGLIGPAARPAVPFLKEIALGSASPVALDAVIAIQNIELRDVERSF